MDRIFSGISCKLNFSFCDLAHAVRWLCCSERHGLTRKSSKSARHRNASQCHLHFCQSAMQQKQRCPAPARAALSIVLSEPGLTQDSAYSPRQSRWSPQSARGSSTGWMIQFASARHQSSHTMTYMPHTSAFWHRHPISGVKNAPKWATHHSTLLFFLDWNNEAKGLAQQLLQRSANVLSTSLTTWFWPFRNHFTNTSELSSVWLPSASNNAFRVTRRVRQSLPQKMASSELVPCGDVDVACLGIGPLWRIICHAKAAYSYDLSVGFEAIAALTFAPFGSQQKTFKSLTGLCANAAALAPLYHSSGENESFV
eukprot:3201732-Amphidinium_carterae.2